MFPLSESAKRFRSAKVKVTQCQSYAQILTGMFFMDHSVYLAPMYLGTGLETYWDVMTMTPLPSKHYSGRHEATKEEGNPGTDWQQEVWIVGFRYSWKELEVAAGWRHWQQQRIPYVTQVSQVISWPVIVFCWLSFWCKPGTNYLSTWLITQQELNRGRQRRNPHFDHSAMTATTPQILMITNNLPPIAVNLPCFPVFKKHL